AGGDHVPVALGVSGQRLVPSCRTAAAPPFAARARDLGARVRSYDALVRAAAGLALHPARTLLVALWRTGADDAGNAALDSATGDGDRHRGALPCGPSHHPAAHQAPAGHVGRRTWALK